MYIILLIIQEHFLIHLYFIHPICKGHFYVLTSLDYNPQLSSQTLTHTFWWQCLADVIKVHNQLLWSEGDFPGLSESSWYNHKHLYKVEVREPKWE